VLCACRLANTASSCALAAPLASACSAGRLASSAASCRSVSSWSLTERGASTGWPICRPAWVPGSNCRQFTAAHQSEPYAAVQEEARTYE